MPRRFRTYDLAVAFYTNCSAASFPSFLKNQILRASSSAALNLAEGAAQRTLPMRRKHYQIAYASIKECQSVLDLAPIPSLQREADCLGAHVYKLLKSVG